MFWQDVVGMVFFYFGNFRGMSISQETDVGTPVWVCAGPAAAGKWRVSTYTENVSFTGNSNVSVVSAS